MEQTKHGHISAYTQPTHLIFGTVIDIVINRVTYSSLPKNRFFFCRGCIDFLPSESHKILVTAWSTGNSKASIRKLFIFYKKKTITDSLNTLFYHWHGFRDKSITGWLYLLLMHFFFILLPDIRGNTRKCIKNTITSCYEHAYAQCNTQRWLAKSEL